MKPVIEVTDLTKTYEDFQAIQKLNFVLEENKIYGLLGRNGAGKTTLMKLITAQIFQTSGSVKIFGEEPYENLNVLQRICFIKESQKYPQMYSVKDVLEIAEALYPNWDQSYAMALIREFNLPLKKKMQKLSRGMLSAVGIVVGLASRAPLTIFDEPYLGLDAVSRGIFYDQLMKDYAEHPRTIILSSHLIDEVSNLLEHILLIDRGQLIINEEAEDLRGMAYTVTGNAMKVEAFITGKDVIYREPFGGLLSATILSRSNQNDQRLAVQSGLEITPVSLQQLIVHLTKKTNKNGGVVAQ